MASAPSSPASSPIPASYLRPAESQWDPYLSLPESATRVFLSEICDALLADLTAREVLEHGIGNVIVVKGDEEAQVLDSIDGALNELKLGNYPCDEKNFEDIYRCSAAANQDKNILILAPEETGFFLAACLWVFKARSSQDPLTEVKKAGVQLTESYETSLQKFYEYLQKKLEEVPLEQPPKTPPLPPKPIRSPVKLKEPTASTALLAAQRGEAETPSKCCNCWGACFPSFKSPFSSRGSNVYVPVPSLHEEQKEEKKTSLWRRVFWCCVPSISPSSSRESAVFSAVGKRSSDEL